MSSSILRRAVNLSRQGKHTEALAQAHLLAQGRLTDPRFAYQIALIQLEGEQPEAALETLDKSTQPDSPVRHLYRALTLGQLNRWNEALDAAQQLKAVCPDHQFLPSLMCYLLLGAGQVEDALKPLQVDKPLGLITWFRPELAGFGPLLSRLLLQVEAYLLPLEFPQLEEGLALDDPTGVEFPPQKLSLEALINSIKGYWQQRKGLGYWEKGLTTNDPKKRFEYLEKNLAAQQRAVQLEPLQFRGYYHLGEALLYAAVPWEAQLPDRARLLEAEKCFIHSWKQEGENPYLYFYLGRTVQLLGRPLAARAYFERALSKFEKFPEAHYALGQLHLLMGEPARAREWLKKSVSSDFLPMARERLFELHTALKQGKLDPKPVMPVWPPPPAAGNDRIDGHPQSTENDSVASEERAAPHRSEDPTSPPENHETFPSPPEPTAADSPASPEVPVPD